MDSLTWKSQQDSLLFKTFPHLHATNKPCFLSKTTSHQFLPYNVCSKSRLFVVPSSHHQHVVSHLCVLAHCFYSAPPPRPLLPAFPTPGHSTRASLTHAFTQLILMKVPSQCPVHASWLYLPRCLFTMCLYVIFLWRVSEYATPKYTNLA